MNKFIRKLAPSNTDYQTLSQERLSRKNAIMLILIGGIAGMLPIYVTFIDFFGSASCPRSSISHYYYEPFAGPFFVLAMGFVGSFMIAYHGENRMEGNFATAGGAGALLLAFFPTSGLGCPANQFADFRAWFDIVVPLEVAAGTETLQSEFVLPTDTVMQIGNAWSAILHGSAAFLLFAMLILIGAMFAARERERSNYPYNSAFHWLLRLGVGAMTIGVIVVVLGFFDVIPSEYRPVFWGEYVALTAFSVTWILNAIATHRSPVSA